MKELRSKPANARDSSADADAAGDTIFVAPGSFYAVRINSGKFGVPWARTKAVLQRGMFDLYVVRPPGEDEVGNKPEQIPAAVKRKRKLEEREVDTRKLKKRREGRKIARNKREI